MKRRVERSRLRRMVWSAAARATRAPWSFPDARCTGCTLRMLRVRKRSAEVRKKGREPPSPGMRGTSETVPPAVRPALGQSD